MAGVMRASGDSEQVAEALIEQAKGVLAAHLQISTEEAFALLRQHARDSRRLLKDVAAETVNNSGSNIPDHRA